MELKKLMKKNPWWNDDKWYNNDFHLNNIKIKRNYEPIKKFDEGIYSLRGPRQVGKTTWIKLKIKELLKKNEPKQIFYYSLDLIKKNNELKEIIETFIEYSENKTKYIFLDEIPCVEKWELALKDLYDSGLLKKCIIVVTGSHSLDISRNIEKLPGRVGKGKRDYIFFPMSFSEIINLKKNYKFGSSIKDDLFYLESNSKEIFNLFNEYIRTGGFPIAINEIDATTYETYIRWIIGDLTKWNKKELFSKQILMRILETYTNTTNWSTIKSKTDIESHSTAADYVISFEEMFLVNFIYLYNESKKKGLFQKVKKIYTTDPFIYAVVKKWTFDEDIEEEDISKIVEGMVLNCLIRVLFEEYKFNFFDYKDKIFYHKNKSGTKETDFIIKNLGKIEVKWKMNVSKKFDTLVLSKNTLNINNQIMPVQYFLILFPYYKEKIFKSLKLIY